MEVKKQTSLSMPCPLASSWRRGREESEPSSAAREASCAGRCELFARLRRPLPRSRVARDGSRCRSSFNLHLQGPLEHVDVCSVRLGRPTLFGIENRLAPPFRWGARRELVNWREALLGELGQVGESQRTSAVSASACSSEGTAARCWHRPSCNAVCCKPARVAGQGMMGLILVCNF